MSNCREQILISTSDMLENQGFHATSLNDIVRASGAPKGSIYYYFPGGKNEIVMETVAFAGLRAAERIVTHLDMVDDPADAIRTFLEMVAYYVEESGFRAGGPLTIVASESATTNEMINLTCREAYTQLHAAFAQKLHKSGMNEAKAVSLSWTILAAVEGAIILSRTFQSGEPLREAAGAMAELINKTS